MRWPGLVLVVVAVTAGCAPAPPPPKPEVAPPHRDDLVVLLPDRDGKVGALDVTHGARQETLESPYAAARVKQEGQLISGRVTPEEVREVFAEAIAALPPRPVTFVLYFIENSDDLTPESKLEMQKILPEIAAHPAPEIVVVEHTDRLGTVPYNDALSLRRAERVRGELVKIGIERARIQVAGRGEREPLVPTEDEVAEPRNRRVEITVR